MQLLLIIFQRRLEELTTDVPHPACPVDHLQINEFDS